MSEIVNLRQARKRAERKRKEAEAAENRAKFGESKADRTRRQDEGARLNKALDQAERQDEKDR